LYALDYCFEVFARILPRQSSEKIIAAEKDDDKPWILTQYRVGNSLQSARRRITAAARVDHRPAELAREHGGIILPGTGANSFRQAVAETDNRFARRADVSKIIESVAAAAQRSAPRNAKMMNRARARFTRCTRSVRAIRGKEI
jgi:hypothetical protein